MPDTKPTKGLFVDLDETLVNTQLLGNAWRKAYGFGNAEGSEYREYCSLLEQATNKYSVGDDVRARLVGFFKNYGLETVFYGFNGMEYVHVTKARPSAARFLLMAHQHFDCVHILTTGHRTFQEDVLRAVGLRDLVDDLFGLHEIQVSMCRKPDETRLVPATDVALLVDNVPVGSNAYESKLRAMGVMPLPPHDLHGEAKQKWMIQFAGHYVRVKSYMGDSDESAPLYGEFQLFDAGIRVQIQLKELLAERDRSRFSS